MVPPSPTSPAPSSLSSLASSAGLAGAAPPTATLAGGSLMRRVLIVSPLFPPDAQVGAKRPLRFVRHLRDHGWEPVVLCLPRPLAMNADDDLGDALPEGVEVFRDYAGGLSWKLWSYVQGLGEHALGRGMEGAARAGRRGGAGRSGANGGNGGAVFGPGAGEGGGEVDAGGSNGHGGGAHPFSATAGGEAEAQARAAALLAALPGEGWAPERARSVLGYTLLKEAERIGWSLWPFDQCAPWVPHAVRAARRIVRPRRVDAVLAIGDPFSAFFVGAALKRSLGLPLVLDLRDPWTIDPAWFSKKVAPLRRLESFVERSLFGLADGVVLNTREALRAYRNLYPELAGQMDCIPNGFDRSLFRPAPAVVRGGPFTLLHFGNVFGGRSVTPILRAARRLIDAGELSATDFRLVVRGELDVSDALAAQSLGLRACVEVRAYRPYREAMIELRAADVLVALEARDLTLQIPAKVYDYLCAERPILSVGQPGEASDLIERLGVGMHFRPEDEAGIAAALARWLQNRHAPFGGRRGIAGEPREPARDPAREIDEYDAPRQTAHLAAALERAVASAALR